MHPVVQRTNVGVLVSIKILYWFLKLGFSFYHVNLYTWLLRLYTVFKEMDPWLYFTTTPIKILKNRYAALLSNLLVLTVSLAKWDKRAGIISMTNTTHYCVSTDNIDLNEKIVSEWNKLSWQQVLCRLRTTFFFQLLGKIFSKFQKVYRLNFLTRIEDLCHSDLFP